MLCHTHFLEWDIWKWDERRFFVSIDKGDEGIDSLPSEDHESITEMCDMAYLIEVSIEEWHRRSASERDERDKESSFRSIPAIIPLEED